MFENCRSLGTQPPPTEETTFPIRKQIPIFPDKNRNRNRPPNPDSISTTETTETTEAEVTTSRLIDAMTSTAQTTETLESVITSTLNPSTTETTTTEESVTTSRLTDAVTSATESMETTATTETTPTTSAQYEPEFPSLEDSDFEPSQFVPGIEDLSDSDDYIEFIPQSKSENQTAAHNKR